LYENAGRRARSSIALSLGKVGVLDKSGVRRERRMARKTIRVSDQSGAEIEDGKGAVVRITFNDARKGVRELDLTDAEAEKLGGRAVARRGRRPKAAS
jgi:hypothetical protein